MQIGGLWLSLTCTSGSTGGGLGVRGGGTDGGRGGDILEFTGAKIDAIVSATLSLATFAISSSTPGTIAFSFFIEMSPVVDCNNCGSSTFSTSI